jgi:cytochrome c oxidase cbb3-type subunit 1
MWRTYNESGTLAYSFIETLIAMHPYYVARAVGGLLFLIGGCLGAYNVLMTIRVPDVSATRASDIPQPAVADAGVLQAAE